MMDNWQKRLKFDPIPRLLSSGNEALLFYVRRDLLGEDAGCVQRLWQLPEAQRILKKQLADGSWPCSGEHKHADINVRLIETWRQFRCLVEQYGFTCDHPQVQKAAEYLFSCQTPAGDIRGMLANQYAPYYTGAIMALLIQAGYASDPRMEKGFQWLLAMRQNDQGWTIPLLTHQLDRATLYRLTSESAEPLEPDRSKPFSHNWTGMVLRAFAVHPVYARSTEAQIAAGLLKSRFFQPDSYTSYQAADYWVRFDYPFWWSNLLTALDSLARMGFSGEDEAIRQALAWFADHQQEDGLWKVSYARPDEPEKETAKAQETKLWVSLAICRVFKKMVG